MQDADQLRTLFERAMEQPAPLRMAFLRNCGLKSTGLEQLARLISAAERETGFMPTGGIKRSAFEPSLNLGTRVADWQVHAFLGVGGMGEVYAVKREGDGFTQSGALKIGPLDPVEQARLFNERFLLAKLEHPNIPRLIDGGTDPHAGAFIVMELVDGKPLLEALRGCDLKERLIDMIDLISAVAHAHAKLIVHRDIKPSNILIDEQGRLRLIDFGVGLDFETEPTDFSSPSTPGYAAPEQRLGGTVTVAADIYALGRVLLDLSEMDEPGRPLRRPVPSDLGAIISKATAQNPSKRYESADALADDIRRFLNGQAGSS